MQNLSNFVQVSRYWHHCIFALGPGKALDLTVERQLGDNVERENTDQKKTCH